MELRKLFDDDLRLKKEYRAKLKEPEGDLDTGDFPLTRPRAAKIDGKLSIHPGTSDLGSLNLQKSKRGKRGDELAEIYSRSNTCNRKLTFT